MLPWLAEGRAVVAAAMIPILPPLIYGIVHARKQRHDTHSFLKSFGFRTVSLFLGAAAALTIMVSGAGWLEVSPSVYKSLYQHLQFPDTRIAFHKTGLRGDVDLVESPYLRFAPGLSLTFTDTLPPQSAVYVDGDTPLYLYHITPAKDVLGFARHTLSYGGYRMRSGNRCVLLIPEDGGVSIACALASGAEDIRIVHSNPIVAEVLRKHYRLPVVTQRPRSYLSRSPRRFDVIHLEHWGASISDAAALDQTPMLTIDAFRACLEHLSPGGIFTVSGRLRLPPADSIRLWSSAFEALRRQRVASPADHLILLRNWDTFTLIVGTHPLNNTGDLLRFVRRMNFDPVYLPQLPAALVNRFNQFDQPVYFQIIRRVNEAYRLGGEGRFFRSYPLDVAPRSDLRPFAARVMKWSRLKDIFHATGGRIYRIMLSGEMVVAVVLVEALLISALLLILPIRMTAGRSLQPSWSLVGGFFGIGAGFILVELYFIYRFVLFCGDPVISMMLVLSGVLIATSIGSLISQHVSRPALGTVLPALGVVMGATALLLETMSEKLLQLAWLPTLLCLIAALLPVGLLMGIPFPALMRHFLVSPQLRAYAWAVNGCASVLGSIFAAQVAITCGIPWIAVCALLAYLAAWMSIRGLRPKG